jgi:hypothetical protein
VQHIILAGFDFAWKGKVTHVPGHLAEKKPFHFDPNRHVTMKNKWGDAIYSDAAYVTALKDLEKDLTESSGPIISNLYGGGMCIQGAPEVSFEQLRKKGVLAANGKNLQRFLKALHTARRSRSWPRFEARADQWAQSLRAVEKKLARLYEDGETSRHAIPSVMEQIVVFLKQDPLYKPYLFNEILDVTYLSRKKGAFDPADLTQCKEIINRVLKKVAEVDCSLVYERKEAA